MPEREYNPELYPPRISESFRKGLFWAGIGGFCGLVFGFVAGVIVSGLVRAG